MPWAPKRPCTWAGCGRLTDGGRCEEHRQQEQRAYNRQRGGSTKQGYGSKWQKARAEYLKTHPLCTTCFKAATVVDHIVPHKGNPELFWNRGNWQPLCKSCHDSKTAREDGRWGGAGRISGAYER